MMKKKIYEKPVMQVVEMEYQGVLAQSFGDPAEEPAHVREFEDMDFLKSQLGMERFPFQ